MPFDDPNYKKPRYGSAVGQGLGALAGGYVQGAQLNNQTKQVEYQNPDRDINTRDILSLLVEDYKNHNFINELTPNAAQPYDPGKIMNLVQAINTFPGKQGQNRAQSQGQNASIQIPQGAGGAQPTFLSAAQAQGQAQGPPARVDRAGKISSLIEELYQARKAKGG